MRNVVWWKIEDWLLWCGIFCPGDFENIEESGPSCRQKLEKVGRERTMISVDGYTVIPLKGKAGYEWSCTDKWKVVRIPGHSTWKKIHGRPGLNDLTKPERDELVRSLRLASTE